MVVRRLDRRGVLFMLPSPRVFGRPTSAPTLQSLAAVTRRFLLKSEIPAPNHCLVTRLCAPQRSTQDAETETERERESRRKLKP